jgi:hypothetical protein
MAYTGIGFPNHMAPGSAEGCNRGILALRVDRLVGETCGEKDRYRHSNRTHVYDGT